MYDLEIFVFNTLKIPKELNSQIKLYDLLVKSSDVQRTLLHDSIEFGISNASSEIKANVSFVLGGWESERERSIYIMTGLKRNFSLLAEE